jgi:hypothetical protein
MDTGIRDRFVTLWQQFCPGAELPITFEIGEGSGTAEKAKIPGGWRCIICDLARVRKGTSLVFDRTSVTCSGGLFYLGYDDEINARHVSLPAEDRCYTFRRWDKLAPEDNPDVVIFFARPEVLSALFTLANFDQADPNGVICPFGSGCSSIIHYPRLEQQSDHPRAVFGMFDPSARPCVPVDILTFAIPMKKFEKMIGFMEESFLITKTWDKVKTKIARSNAVHAS